MRAIDFDPEQDWPPDGATVRWDNTSLVFNELGTPPGWYTTDGMQVTRPFDPAGIAVARRWKWENTP